MASSIAVSTPPPPQVRVGVGVFVLSSLFLSPLSSSPLSPSKPSRITTPTPTPNPHFILGKRINSHGSGTYALPGGHLEFGETPESCAAREVLEETGLIIPLSSIRFLTATNDYMPSEKKHYITLFMVCVRENENDEPDVKEPEKCEGWEWACWEDLIGWVRKQREASDGEVLERRLFSPLVNLVVQRPGVIPGA